MFLQRYVHNASIGRRFVRMACSNSQSNSDLIQTKINEYLPNSANELLSNRHCQKVLSLYDAENLDNGLKILKELDLPSPYVSKIVKKRAFWNVILNRDRSDFDAVVKHIKRYPKSKRGRLADISAMWSCLSSENYETALDFLFNEKYGFSEDQRLRISLVNSFWNVIRDDRLAAYNFLTQLDLTPDARVRFVRESFWLVSPEGLERALTFLKTPELNFSQEEFMGIVTVDSFWSTFNSNTTANSIKFLRSNPLGFNRAQLCRLSRCGGFWSIFAKHPDRATLALDFLRDPTFNFSLPEMSRICARETFWSAFAKGHAPAAIEFMKSRLETLPRTNLLRCARSTSFWGIFAKPEAAEKAINFLDAQTGVLDNDRICALASCCGFWSGFAHGHEDNVLASVTRLSKLLSLTPRESSRFLSGDSFWSTFKRASGTHVITAGEQFIIDMCTVLDRQTLLSMTKDSYWAMWNCEGESYALGIIYALLEDETLVPYIEKLIRSCRLTHTRPVKGRRYCDDPEMADRFLQLFIRSHHYSSDESGEYFVDFDKFSPSLQKVMVAAGFTRQYFADNSSSLANVELLVSSG